MRVLFFILAILISFSCKREFNSEKEFYNWASDPENGLIKSHEHEGILIKARFLPEDYLVYNELKRHKHYSKEQADSVAASYKETLTFLLTLEFKGVHAGENSLLQGASDYQDYRERIDKLNFHLDDYISMRYGSTDFKPLIWTLENNYTAGNRKGLYVVFKKLGNSSENPQKELDLVFDDEIFYTGMNHFIFNREHLEAVPSINFWKFEQ